jgi:activator of 2-hydroxyglutaryl-CoA dehydratase
LAATGGKIIPDCGVIKAGNMTKRFYVAAGAILRATKRKAQNRDTEIKARLTQSEKEAFTKWRKERGLTTSQALRVIVARTVQFGSGGTPAIQTATSPGKG